MGTQHWTGHCAAAHLLHGVRVLEEAGFDAAADGGQELDGAHREVVLHMAAGTLSKAGQRVRAKPWSEGPTIRCDLKPVAPLTSGTSSLSRRAQARHTLFEQERALGTCQLAADSKCSTETLCLPRQRKVFGPSSVESRLACCGSRLTVVSSVQMSVAKVPRYFSKSSSSFSMSRLMLAHTAPFTCSRSSGRGHVACLAATDLLVVLLHVPRILALK